MQRPTIAYALTALLLLLTVTGDQGNAQDATAAPALVDPKAEALLRQTCQTLASAKEFSLRSTSFHDDLTPSGMKLQFARQTTVSVRRPGAIHAAVKGDRENYVAVYDGKTVAFHDPARNEYASAPMPDTIDAALDTLATKYGLVAPLADFLFSNPQEALTAQLRAGAYVGESDLVGGVPTHHLAFRSESVDWQLWVDKTDRPLPRKLVITYKQLPEAPQFVATMDQWELSPKFAPELFKFTPPPGARQVELRPLPTTQPTGR